MKAKTLLYVLYEAQIPVNFRNALELTKELPSPERTAAQIVLLDRIKDQELWPRQIPHFLEQLLSAYSHST